jgi:hypothetical protein
MLDDKLSPPAIARHLQHVFGICRATAYNDIKTATDMIDNSDDGPETTYDPMDPQDTLKQLHHQWRAAISKGKAKDAKLWGDMIDKVKRQHGIGGPHSKYGSV